MGDVLLRIGAGGELKEADSEAFCHRSDDSIASAMERSANRNCEL
jgi:hypothetical protein